MKASPASAVASRGAEPPAVSTGKGSGKPISAKPTMAKASAGKSVTGKPAVDEIGSATDTKAAEIRKPEVAHAETGSSKAGASATARPSIKTVSKPPHPVVRPAAGSETIGDLAEPKSPVGPGISESQKADAPQAAVKSADVAVSAVRSSGGEGAARYSMPPPRPMAKAETFVEGDHVVYPTHGVGKVERIAIEDIAGHRLELIHITFEENRMTLRVPVAKARSAGLRKLATRKMFDEALGVLKGRARIKRTMWSRRAQEYEAKINSGDPLAIAEVVRDLHRNAGQPDQSFSERQIYEQAMDRLAAELAALDQTDKNAAATKLAEFLKTV